VITICTRIAAYESRDGSRFPYWQAFVKGADAPFYGKTRAEAVGNCVLGAPEFSAPRGVLSLEQLDPVELSYQSMLAAAASASAATVKGGA
jgi:hypothetical protein